MRKRNIKFLGIVLLLVYATNFTSSFSLHHHEKIVTFEKANSCEKAIYYGIQDNHSQHISKTQPPCKLCESHVITPEILFELKFDGQEITFFTSYSIYHLNFHSAELTHASNKDPPFV